MSTPRVTITERSVVVEWAPGGPQVATTATEARVAASTPAVGTAKASVATANREAWLGAAIEILRPMFADAAGVELPADIAVSCGWPGGKSVRKVIGQCWPTKSGDGIPHLFISPTLAEPVEVLATLVHELVHAWDDCENGHKAPFGRVARALGLEGKLTATHAGERLHEQLAIVADTLGPYPHKRISVNAAGTVKKQTTRMLKVECPACGYVVRTTAKWLELGTPTCVCGESMEAAA